MKEKLPKSLQESRYILGHLSGHLVIGVLFAVDPTPLPLGTVARSLWVMAARLIEEFRQRKQLARIHSLRIFLIAAIPLIGYSAYFFALRRQSPELSAVAFNSFCLWRYQAPASQATEKLPAFVSRMLQPLWRFK